jgi:hypothetical protein
MKQKGRKRMVREKSGRSDDERLRWICGQLADQGVVERAVAWKPTGNGHRRVLGSAVGRYPEGGPPQLLPPHLAEIWSLGTPTVSKPFGTSIYAPVFDRERRVGIVHGDIGRYGSRVFGEEDLSRVEQVIAASAI